MNDHQGSLWDLGSPDMPPRQPPAQRHSETSVAAAESIRPFMNALQQKVLDYLRECGTKGATDEEGIEVTGLCQNTYRPRRIELCDMGLVVKSWDTRPTRSGRAAVVWKVAG
jgi:hypothetical protein